MKNTKNKQTLPIKNACNFLKDFLWHDRSKLGKIWVGLHVLFICNIAAAYGLHLYHKQSQANEPLVFGATFIDNYAEYFGLDPQETLQASIDELGITRYRLVSYWKDHEPQPDQYDFTDRCAGKWPAGRRLRRRRDDFLRVRLARDAWLSGQ